MPDETQQLVGARYELHEVLGTGATGTVYAAEDTVLGRTVAIKAVELGRRALDDESEALTRVLREARAAARIDDPRSVRVFDVLEEGHRVYLVMELVSAPTLAEVVAQRGPLVPADAARLGLDVLGALAVAHKAGIVHRDVKPSNVMVLPDGRAKLGDFGIASVVDDASITATGMVMGTPRFMAPEQARGERAGAPADIWALGALLHFAVEGEAPFDRDGGGLPTLHAIVNDDPQPMRRTGPLANAVGAMLHKDPTARPDDDATRRLLERAAVTPPGDATAIVAAVAPTHTHLPPVPPRPATAPAPPGAAGKGWRWAMVLVAVVALLAVGLGIAAAQRDDDPDDVAEPADRPTTASTAAVPSTTSTTAVVTTTSAPRGAGRPAGVPADWKPYAAPAGWSIWHPADWTPTANGVNAIDFRTAGGDYLRVDTVAKAGPDPVQAWKDAEKRFQRDYPDYQRVRLEAANVRNWPGAIWEFTFAGQHAVDLGFIVGERGYALNLVTDAGSWESRQDELRAFTAAFTPA